MCCRTVEAGIPKKERTMVNDAHDADGAALQAFRSDFRLP